MTTFMDGETLRGDATGRALKRNGKKVKHHERCEANMCDGWPTCRILDGYGGAIRIDSLGDGRHD